MIEIGKTEFCKRAKIVLKDFFTNFYNAYYITKTDEDKEKVLCHSNEINDSHLGYANRYGHGNTYKGLLRTFKVIEDYVDKINITNLFELVLYVPGFAEDGMSDLITNILYKELTEYTLSICEKYNVKTETITCSRYYWDSIEHSWKQYVGKSLIINGKSFLLIPKEIVQTHYRFTVDNFLRSVIVKNICESLTTRNQYTNKIEVPPRGPMRLKIISESGSHLKAIKKYAQKHPDFLFQYQKIVNRKYQTLKLSDSELDNLIYK